MPSPTTLQDTLAQTSLADLLFASLPAIPSEPPLSVSPLPVPASVVGHTAYTVPVWEALRVGEEKESGKWSRSKPETDGERTARLEAQRAKADEMHDRVKAGLQALADALAQGQSGPLRAFLDSLARFHRYSWGNTLLIDLQRPDATLVAGFTTWKEMGRHVLAGEKGIAILAPLAKRIQAETEEARQNPHNAPNGAQNGVQAAGGAELRLTGKTQAANGVWGFKVVYVFDVSQTDGKPLPDFATMQGDPASVLPRLKALVTAERITLEYQEDPGGGALGRSYGGRIALKTGLPPAQEFAVLVHELAHELLHPLALRASIPKTVKETEAEAVAYVVSRVVGLEPGTASCDYIHLNQGDAATLAGSLERIQKTATRILSCLEADAATAREGAVSF